MSGLKSSCKRNYSSFRNLAWTGSSLEIEIPNSFHISTLIRRRRNKIEALNNEDGIWVHDNESLKNIAVRFYYEPFSADMST